jgi:hypothetical protein
LVFNLLRAREFLTVDLLLANAVGQPVAVFQLLTGGNVPMVVVIDRDKLQVRFSSGNVSKVEGIRKADRASR